MPRVRLNFPNVLNTSVQVGDYAYFSNPRAVGPVREYPNENGGVPGGGTHTPHMTNDQSEIIMIGEILQVGEWLYEDNLSIRSHNTFAGRPPVPNAGFIICDMPQDLFNQYWDQIVDGKCETTRDPSADVITGDCANYIHAINHPAIDSRSESSWLFGPGNYSYNGYIPPSNPFIWFFDNPTVDSSEVLFHMISDPTLTGTTATFNNACEVQPNTKDVNGVDDIVPGLKNLWRSAGWFQLSVVNLHGTFGNYQTEFPIDGSSNALRTYGQAPPGHTTAGNVCHFYPANFQPNSTTNYNNPGAASANDMISKMIELYPNGGYSYGMTYQEFIDHHENYMNTFLASVWNAGGQPPEWNFDLHAYFGTWSTGSYIPGFITNCEEPSYIMFSKDNKANMSSLVGYYASVELRNNSLDKAELFNVGSVFTESSK
jgi:hypothetical protein|tara:strand:- start:3083 stop:4369 length:1287 start_codon:yes stop_codon:yes gene_type:complete